MHDVRPSSSQAMMSTLHSFSHPKREKRHIASRLCSLEVTTDFIARVAVIAETCPNPANEPGPDDGNQKR